jgi:hypothetical protein
LVRIRPSPQTSSASRVFWGAGGCATYLFDRTAEQKYERGTLGSKDSESLYADLRGAQGVQLGESNEQHNFFGGNPQ